MLKRLLRKLKPSRVPAAPQPAPTPPVDPLDQVGKGTIGLIDVGSVGGLDRPWNAHAGELSTLLNFDPNEPPNRGDHVLTLQTALWHEPCELPFYIYKGMKGTGSSLFRQNFDYVDAHWQQLQHRGPKHLAETWHERSQRVRTETLPCRTLDAVLREDVPDLRFHFLKIDAQGAEANILRGAEDFLRTDCVGLQLELFTVPLYEGIALRDEVVAWLAGRDFGLAKVYPPHGSFDSQNDCVFLHAHRQPEVQRIVRRVYEIPDSAG